jgi:hypothetical protein
MVKLRFELVREGEQFHDMDPSLSWAKWIRIPDLIIHIGGRRHTFNAAIPHHGGGQPQASLRYFQPSRPVRVLRD